MKQAVNAAQPMLSTLTYSYKDKTNYVAWTLIASATLGSLWAIIVRGAAIEWLVFIMCLMTILTSYILPQLALNHLVLKRDQSSHVVDLEAIVIELYMKRKWRIPGVWYATIEQLVNESELNAEKIKLQQHYEPLFHKSMSQRYILQHLERGQYKSDGVTIIVGDWLGLTTLKKDIYTPLSFIVMPHSIAENEQTYISQLTAQNWHEQKGQASSDSHTRAQQAIAQSIYDEGLQQSNQQNMNELKPYSEGDSIHRIYYHALSRGMGIHILEEKEQLTHIKQVLFIDQYIPPMAYELGKQHFNTLIGWVIDKVVKQLEKGPILIVTDNWCYECYEHYQIAELRRLLAQLKPDVQFAITERLMSLAKILPSHCALSVYTTDWKNSEGWTELAQLAWHKKATVQLQFLSEHRIMTYTMREQQRELEQSGLQIVWRFSNYENKERQLVREGSESYAYH